MGLDMYLDKHVYLGWDHEHNRKKVEGGLPDLSKYGIKSNKVVHVCERAIYWRKVNAIHQWFVKNVQDGVDDCKDYYVDIEKLEELLNIINDVLDNRERANMILPTQGGFFFGSTAYDEYYWEDLVYTRDELIRILKEDAEETENNIYASYYYHSSW